MSYIFISYSHKDKDYAHKLSQHLFDHGLDAWIDDRIDYGSLWPDEVEKRLRECSVFILLMSPNSKQSDWVQSELHLAKQLKKTIYTFLLNGDNWWHLHRIQYVDVRNGEMPPAKFIASLSKTVPEVRDETNQNVSIHISGNVQGSNIVVGRGNKVQLEGKDVVDKKENILNSPPKKSILEEPEWLSQATSANANFSENISNKKIQNNKLSSLPSPRTYDAAPDVKRKSNTVLIACIGIPLIILGCGALPIYLSARFVDWIYSFYSQTHLVFNPAYLSPLIGGGFVILGLKVLHAFYLNFLAFIDGYVLWIFLALILYFGELLLITDGMEFVGLIIIGVVILIHTIWLNFEVSDSWWTWPITSVLLFLIIFVIAGTFLNLSQPYNAIIVNEIYFVTLSIAFGLTLSN